MKRRLVTVFGSPITVFLVALLARLGNLHISQILHSVGPDHLGFGYEVGRIARSLVEGQGYSSPFLYATGPTAWLGPVYPLLLAACFKVFGVYSAGAAVAILSLNSLFASLTCVVIYQVGRENLGKTVGLMAAWFMAIAPFEINFATRWIWDTSLSALLLSVAFLLTLRLERVQRLRGWLGYGLLWGVVALTNPSLLSLLPAAFAWLWYRQRDRKPLVRMALALLMMSLTMVPWTIRNHRALHEFIPLRDNVAMELFIGNHEGSQGYIMTWDHPVWNDFEMAEYAQRGEIAYLEHKMQVFKDFVREHPGRFAELTLKRVLIFWAGVPHPGKTQWDIGIRHAIYFLSSFVALWGLVRVMRRRESGALLYAGIMLLYPIVYYVTHNHARYRHPIEPIMALLGAYLLYTAACDRSSWLRRRSDRSESVLVGSTSNTGRSE